MVRQPPALVLKTADSGWATKKEALEFLGKDFKEEFIEAGFNEGLLSLYGVCERKDGTFAIVNVSYLGGVA